MIRRILLLLGLFCPVLAGCSLSPEISHQTVDYFRANDLAANQIILLNILRAKDGAPLHFSELSQIRGQLTVGASASTTFPFGPLSHATTLPRRLATLGLTVGSAPSFDIASLDTKDFTEGVMKPITPQTAEFFLDEGIDYRMVLLLLASGIRPAVTRDTPYPEMLLNAPNSSRSVCYKRKPAIGAAPTDYRIVSIDDLGMAQQGAAAAIAEDAVQNQRVNQNCPDGYRDFSESEYFAFLREVDHVNRIYPITVRQMPRPVGPAFNLDMSKDLRAVAGIDPAKYMLLPQKSGKFQLMSASRGSSLILCEDNDAGAPRVVSVLGNGDDPTARVPASACDPGKNTADDDDDVIVKADPKSMIVIGKSPETFVLKLRSTLEVIQYVGQVLAFQNAETAAHPGRPERCITVEPQSSDVDTPTCTSGALFHLQNTSGLADYSNVSIGYDGQQWALPDPQPCNDPENRCDHTLETMSLISLLLNQNKSAKDIATTPAVQSVP